jgi:hypothetical protein
MTRLIDRLKPKPSRQSLVEQGVSGAAVDAASGQQIGASMLNCMAAEVGETDQLAVMQAAYDNWMKWVGMEMTEIGTDADEVQTSMYESEDDLPEGTIFLQESAEIALLEKAIRTDGTIPIRVIKPGWGTSGYYPVSVLERDGPKAFPAGTKMYWDHPTETQRKERPERSLDELAAETVGPAMYQADGPVGPGLYAYAKVFEAYKPAVDELAPHIGTSINAPGMGSKGKADGKEGLIVESILPTKLNSIDFVTIAGAGGQILPLFESARHRGIPVAGDAPVPGEDDKDKVPVGLTEARLQEAIAAAVDPLKNELATTKTENARLSEALMLTGARDFVIAQLRKAELPDVTKVRLAESLVKNPPTKDGVLDSEAFTVQITEAIKAEAKYLSEVTGSGRIQGMGSSGSPLSGEPPEAAEDALKGLQSGFSRLGLTESVASKAASGRSAN